MAVGIPIKWSDNTAELRAHLKEGLNQIVATEAGAKKLIDSLSGERMVAAAHKYAAAISEIGGAQKLTTAEATRASAVFDKAIEKYRAMGSTLGPIPDDLKKIATETKAVAVAEKEAAAASDALKKAAQEATAAEHAQSQALAKSAKDLAAAHQASFTRTLDGMQGLSQGAKTAGMAMTAGITAPLVAMAAAGINASAPFEATMGKLVSLAGVSKNELAGVKEHILALAPAVGIGPQKLADAMTIVSSTVADTSTALSILDIAAKGSAAGMGDAFDVARALTAVVNSYGDANITAAKAGDILTQTVKDGGAEAKELAPVLANVVPIAAQLGVSFEEVGANIAVVTKLGVPAAEAVTQLSSVFTALLKETSKGRDALESVGLSYAKLRAEVREKGLMAALIDLNGRFGENKEKLTEVFGRIEALRDIMSTAGQQADTYVEVLGHMNTAAGSLDSAFQQMKGTQVQTWNEVRAALDVVAIRFGDALAPSLIKVLEATKPVLEHAVALAQAFAELPEPVRATIIAMGGLAALVGPLLIGFGAVVGAARTLITSWVAVQAYFAGSSGAIAASIAADAAGATVAIEAVAGTAAVEAAATGSVVTTLTGATAGFGEAALALAGPIGWITGAIIGFGVALYELYEHTETIRTYLDGFADFLQATVVEAWTLFKDSVDDTARIVRDVFIIAWQELRREFHLDELEVINKGIRNLGGALDHDLAQGISSVLAQLPGIHELVTALGLTIALYEKLHRLANTADEAASAAQGLLVGAHPIGPGFVPLPTVRPGGMPSTAPVVPPHVIESHEKLTAAQKKYAEAVAEYNAATGPTYRQLLNQIGNEMYEGIKADLDRKISTNAIVAVYKTNGVVVRDITAAEAAYKKELNEVTAATDKRRASEIEIAKIIKQRTDELNKETIKALDADIAARQKHNEEVARLTMTATDFQKYQLGVQIAQQAIAGQNLTGLAKQTSNTIIETLKLKLTEVGAVWVEHPMFPPKPSFDAAKQEVASVGKTLENLGQSFTQLATISDGSLGTMFKGMAGATVVGKTLGDAVTLTTSSIEKANVAAQAAGAAGGFMNLTSLTSVALAWVGVALAVYQVVDSLVKAHEAAVKAHGAFNFATELANNFHNLGLFSDDLNKSIQDLADTALIDASVQITNLRYNIDGLGRSSQQLANAFATALHIGDIIKELGGFARLSGDQLQAVLGSMRDLFLMIEAGGTAGVMALDELDLTLSDLGQTAVDSGALVSQEFLDMVAHAHEAGVELTKVTDLLQKQAQSGENGILAALKVTDDAYTKRADLLQQITDLTVKQSSQAGEAADATAAKIADLNAELRTQNDIIQATGLHSAAAADAVAGGLLDIIASQVAAGKSFGDAIRAVAPGIQGLETQMKALGLTGGDAFLFLQQQVDLFTDDVAGPALTAIEGWASGLRGLHNAGLLTQGTFEGLADQIGATHDQLVAQGKDGDAVLRAMQGPLQTLWELEQKFGYTTDESTQKLIDQAEAQGLVGEEMKPIQEQMLDATKAIRDSIKELVDALKGVPKAGKTAADGLKDSLGSVRIDPVKVPYTFEPTNSISPDGAAAGGVVTTTGVQYFGAGGLVLDAAWRRWFGATTTGTDTVPIMATPGEGVVTTAGMQVLGTDGLRALNQGLDLHALDGVRTITTPGYHAAGAAVGAAVASPGTGGSEIHHHTVNFAISTLDATDFQTVVEQKVFPALVNQLRRGRGLTAMRDVLG